MVLSGPGRSGGDEPGFEAIGGCVHRRFALNTQLSSDTSSGTLTVSAGPHRNYQAEEGTKNEPDTFFGPAQKKGWKLDPHVSNLRSGELILYILQETTPFSVCVYQVWDSILWNFGSLVTYLCGVV